MYADVLVLSPQGRLDHDNCAEFHLALDNYLEQKGDKSMRCFMLAAKQARAHGGRILIAAMQPVVGEIFEISRFNLILDAFPTVPAALESLSPQSARAYHRT